MNILKRGIGILLLVGLMASCEDDEFQRLEPTDTSNGSTTLIFTNITTSVSGDGTIVTVDPVAVGVDSFVVDFGDGSAPVTISEVHGTATHDYSNVAASADYTISVTAKADGQSDITDTRDITVTHTVTPISTAPASPTGRRYNVFTVFADGYPTGTSATGGTLVTLDSGNNLTQFSRLGTDSGVLELGDEVVVADAFASGIGSTSIHFDVYSAFATGIDKLKITLVDNANSLDYVIDGLDLTDGEWTSFDFDLATDFSAPVVQFDEVKFELGAGGTARDHASITVDNIYLPRMTGSTIINGDFEDGQDFWKWGTFTDGETNPFGSSSDGSDFDIDGNDTGGKTRGAKWSASQSAGEFRSSSSRFAYQELLLTPGADYVLQYQYAIKDDSGTDPIGGRRVVGLILDSWYEDGADAADNLGNNLGFNEGFVAEGKFSDTTDDFGTLVSIPFTANASGEVGIMFYTVSPKDAYVDNVKVIAL